MRNALSIGKYFMIFGNEPKLIKLHGDNIDVKVSALPFRPSITTVQESDYTEDDLTRAENQENQMLE